MESGDWQMLAMPLGFRHSSDQDNFRRQSKGDADGLIVVTSLRWTRLVTVVGCLAVESGIVS